ncbi:hypothetical protein STCU_12129 [Strigomonas culicis]|uniref:Uncharacterized protein n=1 Tax=Strigomonas culicis TaxID=28005 RepID=S9TG35_9TRYP|nr:hypothetical protein STCU_12129 [Strigomonas culicis]|eukprot:EPY15313.1 hypothetical protein STCU_12129 [Strigomonas culicis]
MSIDLCEETLWALHEVRKILSKHKHQQQHPNRSLCSENTNTTRQSTLGGQVFAPTFTTHNNNDTTSRAAPFCYEDMDYHVKLRRNHHHAAEDLFGAVLLHTEDVHRMRQQAEALCGYAADGHTAPTQAKRHDVLHPYLPWELLTHFDLLSLNEEEEEKEDRTNSQLHPITQPPRAASRWRAVRWTSIRSRARRPPSPGTQAAERREVRKAPQTPRRGSHLCCGRAATVLAPRRSRRRTNNHHRNKTEKRE